MRKLRELILIIFILGIFLGVVPGIGLYLLYTFPICRFLAIIFIIVSLIIELR